jgi:K(+)-stimulated pyrophosphate-energized sodium pump
MRFDAAVASIEDSKEVVRICTLYAQRGMWNIFIVIFCMTLALAFFDPYLFIGYLIAIAFFGLFQAIFMANAGGAWDNAKKAIEQGHVAGSAYFSLMTKDFTRSMRLLLL